MVRDLIDSFGWNQPDAPFVSLPLPVRVEVPAFQVGVSVWVPLPQDDGLGEPPQ